MLVLWSCAAAATLQFGGLPCPDRGYLQDSQVLAAMLQARAVRQLIVILVYGWTNGETAIAMRNTGEKFIRFQVENLESMGLSNHLVISSWLENSQHTMDNPCLKQLRPAGICCGWSSIGQHLVVPGGNLLNRHGTRRSIPPAFRMSTYGL